MSQSKKSGGDKKSDNIGPLLLCMGVAVGAFAAYLHLTRTQEDLASRSPVLRQANAQMTNQQMSDSLKDTAIRRELQRHNAEDENEAAAPISSDDVQSDRDTVTDPLILKQEQTALIYNNGRDKNTNQRLTPDQRISLMLQKNAWLRDYDKKYREEYIRQFLQNARDHGVNIKLNKNLDVTGLSTNSANQPLRFPQSVNSAGQTVDNPQSTGSGSK